MQRGKPKELTKQNKTKQQTTGQEGEKRLGGQRAKGGTRGSDKELQYAD